MDDSSAISKTIRSGAIRLNSGWWKLQIWILRGKDTMTDNQQTRRTQCVIMFLEFSLKEAIPPLYEKEAKNNQRI